MKLQLDFCPCLLISPYKTKWICFIITAYTREAKQKDLRTNGFKIEVGNFRLDVWKKFIYQRVAEHLYRLPTEVVDAPSLEVLKSRLDGPWAAWAGGGQPCPWQGSRTWSLRSLPTQVMLWFYEVVFLAGEKTALEQGYTSINLTTLVAEFCGTQQ